MELDISSVIFLVFLVLSCPLKALYVIFGRSVLCMIYINVTGTSNETSSVSDMKNHSIKKQAISFKGLKFGGKKCLLNIESNLFVLTVGYLATTPARIIFTWLY